MQCLPDTFWLENEIREHGERDLRVVHSSNTSPSDVLDMLRAASRGLSRIAEFVGVELKRPTGEKPFYVQTEERGIQHSVPPPRCSLGHQNS